MTFMVSEVYDALVAAGSPEEKARKAAEALTKNEDRLAKIEAELLLIKWMMGFVLAFQVAIAGKLFLH